MAKKQISSLASKILSDAIKKNKRGNKVWEASISEEARQCLYELSLEAELMGVSWRSLREPFVEQFKIPNPPKNNSWADARRRIMEAFSVKKA